MVKIRKPFPEKNFFRRRFFVYFLLVFLLSAVSYLPAIKSPFSVVDDIQYIEQNKWIKEISWENIRHIFSRPYHHNYLPVHLLNYMIDYSLWGENPSLFRAENILWHVLSGCVFFLILKKIFDREIIAIIGTLFFVAHPACVESVAWISERKNVLSQFFGLLSFWFYITRADGRLRYLASVFFCLIAVFAKTSMLILPVVMIVYQWIFESVRNLKKLFVDKIPFILFAVGGGLTAMWAQDVITEMSEVRGGGFLPTVLNVSVVWVRYLRMAFFPLNLSAGYKVVKWGVSLVSISALLFLLLLLVLAVRLAFSEGAGKYFSFGTIWFFVALFPVSNIFPLPVVLKDRYLYLPLIGLAIAFCGLMSFILRQRKISSVPLCVLAILCFVVLTARNAYEWRTPISTWRKAVRVAPNSAETNNVLGTAYQFAYQPEKMIEHKGIALALARSLPHDRVSVARMYLADGKFKEAMVLGLKMKKALPNNPELLTTLGISAYNLGELAKARYFLSSALAFHSHDPLTYLGLALVSDAEGKTNEAIKFLNKSLILSPNMVDAHLKLAILLQPTAPAEALEHFKKVITLAPHHPDRDRIEEVIRQLEDGPK